jgi:hypothetical protein
MNCIDHFAVNFSNSDIVGSWTWSNGEQYNFDSTMKSFLSHGKPIVSLNKKNELIKLDKNNNVIFVNSENQFHTILEDSPNSRFEFDHFVKSTNGLIYNFILYIKLAKGQSFNVESSSGWKLEWRSNKDLMETFVRTFCRRPLIREKLFDDYHPILPGIPNARMRIVYMDDDEVRFSIESETQVRHKQFRLAWPIKRQLDVETVNRTKEINNEDEIFLINHRHYLFMECNKLIRQIMIYNMSDDYDDYLCKVFGIKC